MRYLPISYDTKDKNLLVLGGGLLALSKVKEMLKTEFRIYVISESFVDEFYKLQDQNPTQLYLKELKINEDFVFFSYDFLLIATTNFELNDAIEKRAVKTNILFERCDVISNSNVLLNDVIEQEDIIVGISKERLNPALSEFVKDDIRDLIKGYNPDKFKVLNQIRTELIRKNAPDVDETIKKLFVEEKISADDYLANLKSEREAFESLLQAEREASSVETFDEIPQVEQTEQVEIEVNAEPEIEIEKENENIKIPELEDEVITIKNEELDSEIRHEKVKIIKDYNIDIEKDLDDIDIDIDNESASEDKYFDLPQYDFEIRHDRKKELEKDNTSETEVKSDNPLSIFYKKNLAAKSDEERKIKEKVDKAESDETDETLNNLQEKLKSGWNKFSNGSLFKKDKK